MSEKIFHITTNFVNFAAIYYIAVMSSYHTPVLLEESIELLDIKSDGIYADLTFGGGGHTRRILQDLGDGGALYSFDQDRDTLANAPEDEHFNFVRL